MSQTFQMINIIVLVIAIVFALYRLTQHGAIQSKKKREDDEIQCWEHGAELASKNLEYQTKLKEGFEPLSFKEDTNLRGLPYDKEAWRVTLPQSVVEQLEVCFDGNTTKAYAMKRAIELSLEHYTYEMEDDKECADIIAKRNPNGTHEGIPFEEMLQHLDRNKTKENLQ